jgi:DNA-binding MarR family transcriptional regulator
VPISRDAKRQIIQRIADHAGVDLSPAQCWMLARIDEDPEVDPGSLARSRGVEPELFEDAVEELAADGLVDEDGDSRTLTPAGRATLDRLVAARRERLSEHLAGWSPERHADLARLLNTLAREVDEPVRA